MIFLYLDMVKNIYMGIGDWDWGLGIGPNPQSPIPNPQSPIPILKLISIVQGIILTN